MVRRGHIPLRKCIVCSRRRPKAELVRLGLDDEGRVRPDFEMQMKGRGGYVCREHLPDLSFDRRIQRAFRNRAKELLL